MGENGASTLPPALQGLLWVFYFIPGGFNERRKGHILHKMGLICLKNRINFLRAQNMSY